MQIVHNRGKEMLYFWIRYIPEVTSAKAAHKYTQKREINFPFKSSVTSFPIQILYSNPMILHLVCVFLHTCVSVSVYSTAVTNARTSVCSYSVSIINSRKLIQFIAFTYWPESPLQGGIMADWVCTKTGGRKKGSRRTSARGKENGNICIRKHVGVTRWGLFTD